jgi:hypothetical protein
MTRTATARVAGFTYLFYMAVGAANELVMDRATRAEGTAATLARVARHGSDLRLSIVLTLLECLSALVLAVTLYGITRVRDHELAMLGLVCRVAEGVIGSSGIPRNLGLLWLADAGTGAGGLGAATTSSVGAVLLLPGGPFGAVFFAVGSAVFSWLLLRGRMVPAWLAGLGLASSVLLVVGLPLQLAGILAGPATGYQWAPAMVFAALLGSWLLVRGVAPPAGDAARN